MLVRSIKNGGKGTRDATAYSPNPKNTKSFLKHWQQRQARAATLANARHMLTQAEVTKAHAASLYNTGAARGGGGGNGRARTAACAVQ